MTIAEAAELMVSLHLKGLVRSVEDVIAVTKELGG